MTLKLISFVFDIKPGENGCDCSLCNMPIPAGELPVFIREPRGVLPIIGAFYRFHKACYHNYTVEIENQVGQEQSLAEAAQLHEMRMMHKARLGYQDSETGELGEFSHGTAYRIMTFRSIAGDEILVWNSRDGKCPYVLDNDGVDYFHIKWQDDEYNPHFEPQLGQYFIRDATEEESEQLVRIDVKNFTNMVKTKNKDWAKSKGSFDQMIQKHKLQMKSIYKGFPMLVCIEKEVL